MDNIINVKNMIMVGLSGIGAIIIGLLGGWDTALETLALVMALDYLMGLVLAGVFNKSSKSDTGALNSNSCWIGLAKKCMTLVFVIVATSLDNMMGVDYIRYGVIIGFLIDELISVIENAGLMGIKVPSVIANAIEVLQNKSDK